MQADPAGCCPPHLVGVSAQWRPPSGSKHLIELPAQHPFCWAAPCRGQSTWASFLPRIPSVSQHSGAHLRGQSPGRATRPASILLGSPPCGPKHQSAWASFLPSIPSAGQPTFGAETPKHLGELPAQHPFCWAARCRGQSTWASFLPSIHSAGQQHPNLKLAPLSASMGEVTFATAGGHGGASRLKRLAVADATSVCDQLNGTATPYDNESFRHFGRKC